MALRETEPLAQSLVCAEAELHDPTPDLHETFQHFDFQFFDGALQSCIVSWSKQMTTCAGICRFRSNIGQCDIRLSEKLLKLRPRKDFVETLLHEMIHAYLFLNGDRAGRDGHGPPFQMHMHRINKLAGTNITIYHSFHDEVRLYKQHWWRCDGPCRSQEPFYGYVKRAMNRAPSRNDRWWALHQSTCGGMFHKVKEPTKVEKKATKVQKRKLIESSGKSQNITNWLDRGKTEEPSTSQDDQSRHNPRPVEVIMLSDDEDIVAVPKPKLLTPKAKEFIGTGVRLGSVTPEKADLVCPNCPRRFTENHVEELNRHLDECLS